MLYKVKLLVSKSIYAKKARNGPPGANQGLSTIEPRRGHAVCTLWGHLHISYCSTPSAPKDIARSDIMKLKVS